VIGNSEEIVCSKRSVMIWASNEVVTKGFSFLSLYLKRLAGDVCIQRGCIWSFLRYVTKWNSGVLYNGEIVCDRVFIEIIEII